MNYQSFLSFCGVTPFLSRFTIQESTRPLQHRGARASVLDIYRWRLFEKNCAIPSCDILLSKLDVSPLEVAVMASMQLRTPKILVYTFCAQHKYFN